jgi:hypothetical protein
VDWCILDGMKLSILAEPEKGVSGVGPAADLVAFLLARFDEDDPDRTSPDFASKRDIVRAWADLASSPASKFSMQAQATIVHVFRCLARPYSQHPDFAERWALPSL